MKSDNDLISVSLEMKNREAARQSMKAPHDRLFHAVEETLLRDIFIWYYYTMNEEGTQA